MWTYCYHYLIYGDLIYTGKHLFHIYFDLCVNFKCISPSNATSYNVGLTFLSDEHAYLCVNITTRIVRGRVGKYHRLIFLTLR